MHSKHELGHANPTTGYHSYHKGLLPSAHKNISDAFWTKFKFQNEETIFHYCTGILYQVRGCAGHAHVVCG